MNLANYVSLNSVRGACLCGKCADALANPEKFQPEGHTSDLVFFKVANNGATKEEFETLARKEYPGWFDGKEHNYLETGAHMGDQGIALMTMGLGSLLGTWKLLTPAILGIDGELAQQMAGMGFVSIQTPSTQANS